MFQELRNHLQYPRWNPQDSPQIPHRRLINPAGLSKASHQRNPPQRQCPPHDMQLRRSLAIPGRKSWASCTNHPVSNHKPHGPSRWNNSLLSLWLQWSSVNLRIMSNGGRRKRSRIMQRWRGLRWFRPASTLLMSRALFPHKKVLVHLTTTTTSSSPSTIVPLRRRKSCWQQNGFVFVSFVNVFCGPCQCSTRKDSHRRTNAGLALIKASFTLQNQIRNLLVLDIRV